MISCVICLSADPVPSQYWTSNSTPSHFRLLAGNGSPELLSTSAPVARLYMARSIQTVVPWAFMRSPFRDPGSKRSILAGWRGCTCGAVENVPCAPAVGAHSSAAAPSRIPTQEAPSMLAIFPVMACTPFLDLPLARLARGHAGIHACDVTSGLCDATNRRVGKTIDPIENLDAAARGAGAGPRIASRELQRRP